MHASLTLGVVLGLACAGTASGVLINATYIGPGGGSWTTAANWTPAGVPNNAANTFNVLIDGSASNVTISLTGQQTISGLTVNAGDALTITNSARLLLRNDGSASVANNGTIALGSTGGDTYLHLLGGPVTLGGNGELVLSDNPANWIFRNDGPGALVNGPSHTIRGAGNLGWNGVPTAFTNLGTVRADAAVNALLVDCSGGVTNDGLMQASAGVLRLQGGTLDNTNGLIEALNGQTVELTNSVTIKGGELSTTGTGVIRSIQTTPVIDGTAAPVINNATVEIPNDRRLSLKGEVQNNAAINLSSAGGHTYVHVLAGPVTLSGAGELVLSDNLNNWIYRTDANGALINGASHTIRGAGNLMWNGVPTAFTNLGTVRSDAAVNPLIIDCSGGVTNDGVMQASNGVLRLQGGVLTNTNGVIEALNGQVVELSHSVTIRAGELTSSGTGVIRSIETTPVIDGTTTPVINNAVIQIPNSRRLNLRGELQNNASVQLSSTGSDTYIHPLGGPVTFSAAGELVLSDNPNNWIYRADANGALVNGAAHTIRGAGNLGWNSVPMSIINHGAIKADAAVNFLRLDCSHASGTVNHGLIQVSGGGGMQISGANFNNQGNVVIDATRTLTRSAGAYNQTAGTTTVSGTLTLQAPATLTLNGGIVKGTGTMSGTINNTNGAIEPGNSVGTLNHTGTFNQSANGRLRIELGGTMAGQYDQLIVTGAANVGGVLELVPVNGFVPALGQQFTVLTRTSGGGAFQAVSGTGEYCISYTTTSVVVTVVEPCPADVVCNGTVNVDDLLAVIVGWGACPNVCPPRCLADINNSCSVNVDDLLAVIVGWGPCS